MKILIAFLALAFTAPAAVVPFDIAGRGPGSIPVISAAHSVLVRCKDDAGRPCTAEFLP
jgi:hypothetical protein